MSNQIHTVGKSSNKYKNKFLLMGFFLVLIIILYTTFLGTPQILGNTIFGGNESTTLSKIKISADLTIPEISTKGDFSEIIISAQPSSFFYIADQEIETSTTKKSLILIKGYNGKFDLDRNSLSINGKAEKIFTEDIPISSKSRDYVNIEFGDGFDYSTLEIKNDFSFKSLEYTTSGTIDVEQGTTLSLTNDKVRLEGFIGTIKVSEGRMILNGELSKLTVEGEKTISISG